MAGTAVTHCAANGGRRGADFSTLWVEEPCFFFFNFFFLNFDIFLASQSMLDQISVFESDATLQPIHIKI